jgi:hypothetical protein
VPPFRPNRLVRRACRAAPTLVASAVVATVASACAPPRAGQGSRAQLAASANAFTVDSAPELARPSRPPRRASILYELNGKPFPLPLVRARVAGVPTWFLVDTGANSHVLAGWLARKVGLPLQQLGDIGTDHAGRSIPTYRVDEPDVVIEQWGPLDAGPMLVADVPAPIARLGLGGFLSPQNLPRGAEVLVLDLVLGEMRTTSLEEAQNAVRTRGRPLAPNGVRPCEDNASPIRGLAYVLPALIEGQRSELMVDTGAQRTDVLAETRIGRGLVPRSVPNEEEMYAASGRIQTRTVKGAHIKAGEFVVTADVDIVPGAPDPVCPREGVIAMDVLRACVLVLGARDMFGRCGG